MIIKISDMELRNTGPVMRVKRSYRVNDGTYNLAFSSL